MGRWSWDNGPYEPGAWFKGGLYPRRCDLSPDGRFLCYLARKPNARWEHGETYVAISRLPQLTALAAEGTLGTWTRGAYFAPDGDCLPSIDGAPGRGFRLRDRPTIQFAIERERGWREAPDSPQKNPRDLFDERRDARMLKTQPRGVRVLHMERRGYAEPGEQAVEGIRVSYRIANKGRSVSLDEVQWADWDSYGNLLTATKSGKLQRLRLGPKQPQILFEEDLTKLTRPTKFEPRS